MKVSRSTRGKSVLSQMHSARGVLLRWLRVELVQNDVRRVVERDVRHGAVFCQLCNLGALSVSHSARWNSTCWFTFWI